MSLNRLVDEVRVSSILNDDDKTYGEQFLFDGREDTCWNSECGLPQSIFITFKETVNINQLSLMFQGGFVGTVCEIYGDKSLIASIFPKDINDLQNFAMTSICLVPSQTLELRFTMSSDFYGRITVYMINFD